MGMIEMTVKEALDKLGSAKKKYAELLETTPIVGGHSVGAGTPSGFQSDEECLAAQQFYIDKVAGLATYICILESAVKKSNAITPLSCNGLREGATVAEAIIRQEMYFPMIKKNRTRGNTVKSILDSVSKERTSVYKKKEDALQKVQSDAQLFALKAAEGMVDATAKSALIEKQKKVYIDSNPVRWLEHHTITPFFEKLVWLTNDFEAELNSAIQKSNMETKISVDLTGNYVSNTMSSPGVL